MTYTATELRCAIADAAEAEWAREVLDTQPGYPGDVERIAAYYRACGWSWHLDQHGDGAYVEQYVTDDGDRRFMSWCGVFVGWAARHVGDHLEPDRCVDVHIREHVAAKAMPSTRRLADPAKWGEVEPGRPEPIGITRGDIVVVGHDKPFGDHICIALDTPAGGIVRTVSGNGQGRTPTRDDAEGVVKVDYTADDIAAVYRPQWAHFTGSDLRG